MEEQEFVIEKNIPIAFSKKKVNSIYPFEKMEQGDSFSIKYDDDIDLKNKRLHVCNSFKKFILNNKHAWSYCTRKDNEMKVIRVWRTE